MSQIEAKLLILFWQIQVCNIAFGHDMDVFLLEKNLFIHAVSSI